MHFEMNKIIILAVIVSGAFAFTQSENRLSGEFAKSQPKKSGDIFSLSKDGVVKGKNGELEKESDTGSSSSSISVESLSAPTYKVVEEIVVVEVLKPEPRKKRSSRDIFLQ